MIVKLAIAALVSGIAIPALAIHHLAGLETRTGLPGADSAVSAAGSLGRPNLGPFLSGLI